MSLIKIDEMLPPSGSPILVVTKDPFGDYSRRAAYYIRDIKDDRPTFFEAVAVGEEVVLKRIEDDIVEWMDMPPILCEEE